MRTILDFGDLEGWAEDNHAEALSTFRNTCDLMEGSDWSGLCALANSGHSGHARRFFERQFRPVMTDPGFPSLFTGYFEPEFAGSRQYSERFRFPLHCLPPEAREGRPWKTRREILTTGALEGRGLELAWLDDPVNSFFLQIQGSGRVRLAEGGLLRVGYGGSNGHPYRSVGEEMVRRGLLACDQVTAKAVATWIRRNPIAGERLLHHNPSYVFFREIGNISPEAGPLGAMGRSITPLRSVAVDPGFVPLGAPVWLETGGKAKFRRLMVAQDIGSAIKGPQRADVFFGSGSEAGDIAGRMRASGRLVVLLPRSQAEVRDFGDM